MTSHDEPIPKKKKVKRQSKKTKSDQDDADPLEDGRNYGLDRLNLWETEQESESNSEWLPTQRREIQRSKNRNNSIKCECNILSNFQSPTKRAKNKTSNYSPIIQVYMNTRSGKKRVDFFESYWKAEAVQRLLWVSWRQKLNKNKQ